MDGRRMDAVTLKTESMDWGASGAHGRGNMEEEFCSKIDFAFSVGCGNMVKVMDSVTFSLTQKSNLMV